jgi:hypothetical protein
MKSKLQKSRLLAVCAALAGISASGSASAQTFPVSRCTNADGSTHAEVEWSRTPFLGGYAYSVLRVRAPGGSTSPNGWLLHHRPVQNFPNNYFEPDNLFTGSSIINRAVWEALMPVSPYSYPPGTWRVSSLTCPGGMCTVSPFRGCKATYAAGTGAKVALTGDSLTERQELCVWGPPAAPDYCATPISEHIRNSGRRPYLEYNSGQGFYSWLDVMREQATTAPNIYVMAFGTNDARRQANAAAADRPARRLETVAAVHAAIRATRASNPASCIVLATASQKGNEANYRSEADQVNTFLTNVAADPQFGGNIRVADWAGRSRGLCGANWLSNPGQMCPYFTADHLHLTGRGQDERNAVILAEVNSCP